MGTNLKSMTKCIPYKIELTEFKKAANRSNTIICYDTLMLPVADLVPGK